MKTISASKIRSYLYTAIICMFSISLLLVLPMVAQMGQTVLTPKTVITTTVLGSQTTPLFPTPTPELLPQSKGIIPPYLTAASVIVLDPDTGFIYFSKDPDKRVPIASTTKIMTALVALDQYNPQSILTVDQDASVSGSTMGTIVGEKLTFRSLLYGMMLNSGNDAAFTIADNYPGGLPAFIAAMNEKAAQLSLKNTHFDNPAGFDSPAHYSSASDLAKITQTAISNFQLSKVISTQETTVTSLDRLQVHHLKNLNKLLGKNGVIGVKTGYTPEAKENLIGLAENGNHKILTVVLGSDDRFGETEQMINWVRGNYSTP